MAIDQVILDGSLCHRRPAPVRLGSLRFSSLHFSPLLFCGSCPDAVLTRLRRFAPCCLPIPLPLIGPFPCGPVPFNPGIGTLLVPILVP
jgi:hypothetical protein